MSGCHRREAFPLAVLAEELADDSTRLDTLRTGDLRGHLDAVIASSYRVLETGTADAFQRLASMIGPDIGLPAAARLVEQPGSRTRTMLDELERLHLVQQLETEYDNLVAASTTAAQLGWNDHAWRLADALWYFSYARGHGTDWIDTLLTALRAARRLGDRTGEAATLKQLGNASLQCGRPHDSLRYGENLRTSAGMHEKNGVHHLHASTLGCLSTVLAQLGHIEDALQCGEKQQRPSNT